MKINEDVLGIFVGPLIGGSGSSAPMPPNDTFFYFLFSYIGIVFTLLQIFCFAGSACASVCHNPIYLFFAFLRKRGVCILSSRRFTIYIDIYTYICYSYNLPGFDNLLQREGESGGCITRESYVDTT